jgi:hypothetical protein
VKANYNDTKDKAYAALDQQAELARLKALEREEDEK